MPVNFETNYANALRKARSEKKFLLVDFFSPQ